MRQYLSLIGILLLTSGCASFHFPQFPFFGTTHSDPPAHVVVKTSCVPPPIPVYSDNPAALAVEQKKNGLIGVNALIEKGRQERDAYQKQVHAFLERKCVK